MNFLQKSTASVAVLALLISGCATDPNTGKTTLNTAAIGAISGALGGAVLSKTTGGEHTERDAAIGAALGAGIGYYMQKQEQDLRAQTKGSGIEVQRDPQSNDIRLIMPESITFDKAQSYIKPQFHHTLQKVAKTLNEYHHTRVYIEGHASSEGDFSFNQNLSQARADSVAYYLQNQGVAPHRIQSRGLGIAHPIASNQSEYGRAQNRRVEIIIKAPQQ